ncbi:CvfD/Ygs/GSP13 family RNA-binding post-transcriptional regulator [Companilactobacillus sp.]|uniref:CvfD/Ygs/GSP13 family RNA-binding post-transcriptional regulator n=1 Tax=Companilactobacillus sp. TaxID=2767905 RepID=UPI00263576AD|nr:CvfD/Ygs/GSP13 family RNA-binding post-transcriptional regulator [Companilactobacillus sp.]
MKIGDKLSGKISGIQPYGVFVNLENGSQGLVHISELKNGFVSGIENEYHVGDQVEVIVLDIDEYDGNVSLSMRALQSRKLGRPILHKHFWTNYKDEIGYATIKDNKAKWVRDAMKIINGK